jgi:hypothetical protein
MNNIYNCNFPNLGFVGCDLSQEDMAPIMEEIAEIQNNFSHASPANKTLAGHIQNEYLLSKSHKHIEKLGLSLYYQWCNQFNMMFDKQLFLDKIWVNFQKKYEFNPVHNHNGDFSFVIYCKIPYTMKEEQEASNFNSNGENLSGTFSFHYTNTLGEIKSWTIPADKSFESKMILFPAKMIHSVYPFYSSDEYRISVAGNLFK